MIEVQVFAKLTQYFEEKFSLHLSEHVSQKKIWQVEDIFFALQKINPSAEKILFDCRVAVNETFCRRDHEVKEGDCVFVFPPFSGG